MPLPPRRPDRAATRLPAAVMLAALSAACTGPRVQVVLAPRAFAAEGAGAAALAASPLQHVLRTMVRVEAPRWQATPAEGRLIEVRPDSLWLEAAGGAAPIGVPRGCVTALASWVPGSPAMSASRGSFFGTLIGGAVGLFVNPNPTGWQVGSAAYAIPATVTGALVGTAIGWSRPGGAWVAVDVPSDSATPPCAPAPAAKPKAKPAAKPAAKPPATKP